MTWKIANRFVFGRGENPFRNNFYGYTETDLILTDGRRATYFGLDVGPCVHVVGIEDDLTTYLVRQHRPNLLRGDSSVVPTTLELPGGFAKPGPLEDSAQHEFTTETGRQAGTLMLIGAIHPSPGVSNEVDTIFMGTNLSAAEVGSHDEATEQDLRVVTMRFGEAYDLMRSGRQPVSAQTLAALSMVAARL